MEFFVWFFFLVGIFSTLRFLLRSIIKFLPKKEIQE